MIDADGNVTSVYTTPGLSLKANTRETLAAALDTALSQHDTLLERQRAALARCFPDNEAQLDTLSSLLVDLLRAPTPHTSATSAGSVALSALQIAILSAGNLLQQLRERGRNDN